MRSFRHFQLDFELAPDSENTTSPLFQETMMLFRLVFLILSSLFLLTSSEVFDLNESNFEHQTQASTGQTTGKWFVLFSVSPAQNQALQDLAAAVEEGILVAQVDALKNRKLAIRFGIKYYPTMIFFAGGRMYTYRGSTTGEAAVEAMKTFVETRYKSMDGSIVRSPPSLLDTWKEMIRAASKDANHFLSLVMEDFNHIWLYRKNAAAALILIGGVAGTIFGLLLSFLFPRKRKQAEKAKKD